MESRFKKYENGVLVSDDFFKILEKCEMKEEFMDIINLISTRNAFRVKYNDYNECNNWDDIYTAFDITQKKEKKYFKNFLLSEGVVKEGYCCRDVIFLNPTIINYGGIVIGAVGDMFKKELKEKGYKRDWYGRYDIYNTKEYKTSSYEMIVENYLKDQKYEFTREYSPKWANKKRYDFKIGRVLLEVDGQQHFSQTPIFNKNISFDKIKNVDMIKNKLALENGYRLCRISFSEITNSNSLIDYMFEVDDNQLYFGKEYYDLDFVDNKYVRHVTNI